MSHLNRIFHILNYSIVACSILFMLLIGYWLVLDTKSPLTILYAHPVPIANNVHERSAIIDAGDLHQGASVYRYYEYCLGMGNDVSYLREHFDELVHQTSTNPSNTFIEGVSYRRWVDGVIYLSVDLPLERAVGCFREGFNMIIPSSIPPGDYKYEVTIEFYNNPLQKLIGGTKIALQPIPFTIVGD